MPTVQIWINNEDMDVLRRLKAYLEYKQERDSEGKAWRMYTLAGRRKRIRRKRINDSYIYRQALNLFWTENEKFVLDFEKRERYR
jgi:hypothetical protein